MARSSYHRLFKQGILKLVLASVGFCLACCIAGPPLYWHLKEIARAETSCGSCDCSCESDTTFTITQGENEALPFLLDLCLLYLFAHIYSPSTCWSKGRVRTCNGGFRTRDLAVVIKCLISINFFCKNDKIWA